MAKISFESENLIKELEQDIFEFGPDKIYAVWLRKYGACEFVVNYDFIVEEDPITEDQIGDNERLIFMDARSLLDRLKKQNEIL